MKQAVDHFGNVRLKGNGRREAIENTVWALVMMTAFRNLVGGEIHEYGKLMGESREQALDRMVKEAEELGANAIISVQFTTSVIMNGAAEFLAYGTAVIVE